MPAKKVPKQRSIQLPKSLAHWFQNREAVERLRQIVDDEHFRTAVATLKEEAGPTSSSLSTDVATNSQRMSWYAGYRDAFSDLEKLTKLPTNIKQTNDEWMHILNP